MNYEKKYKEAQKWIESIYSELSHEQQMEAEAFFPELKESEDERIRKSIIKFLIDVNNGAYTKSELEIASWIAWLEKQEGCECIKKDWLEHIKQSWYKEGFIDGKYSDGTSKEWTKNDAATLKELIDFLENGTAKLQHDLTRYANWLKIQLTPIKKQGEPTDINPSEFDLRLNKLLKQFETLPKEELANSLSFYLNVVQNDGTYKPDEKQGELIDKLVKYREWLISKTEQWTERKNDKTNSNAGKHCCIGAANALISARAEFEEIFDYESCFEKQGEQKPANKTEPFDKYEGLTDFERTLADICIGWIGEELGWKQYIKDNADVLLKIAIEKFNSVQDASFEQKPAWSEEDEEMLENIIDDYDDVEEHNLCDDIGKIMWLKSLKYRYTWKPSDEQISVLSRSLKYINTISQNYCHVLGELLAQLKKLREE